MGRKTKKAINFDFIVNIIQDNMSDMEILGTYRKAYYDIRNYLENNGFSHTQESAYVSDYPISNEDAINLISNLTKEIPYLKDAIKSFHITSVEKTYEITKLVNNEHSIEILKPENIYKLEEEYDIKPEETKQRKWSIRFDYLGELLEEKFKENNINLDITKAYSLIGNFLKTKGYEHEQRSVYISKGKKSDVEVLEDILSFSKEYPFLSESLSSIQITGVGKRYNITKIANSGLRKLKENENIYESELENKIDNGISK